MKFLGSLLDVVVVKKAVGSTEILSVFFFVSHLTVTLGFAFKIVKQTNKMLKYILLG